MTRADTEVTAILLVGDCNWRDGPKWRAALAWAFGRPETILTHHGDIAVVHWWRGEPFLVSLKGARA